MKDFTFERFITIAKVDDEKRMVYGYASTKDMDSDGEVIELEAMKKALPSYMNFPTLREMHQPKVAGTTKQAEIDKNGLYIGAKVLSEEAWQLVKGGGYKGFSIGGNVIRRDGNKIKDLELIEISLVDVPANKGAKIELWKKEKVEKDSVGIAVASDIMSACKNYISDLSIRGKKTKKAEKLLEQIKAFIAEEAGEADAKKATDQVQLSQMPADELLKLKLERLQQMDLSSVSQLAESIRKGMVLGMNKQMEEMKKSADEQAAEKKLEAMTKSAEEVKEEEKKEEPTAPETPKTEEVKVEVPTDEEKKEEAEPAKEEPADPEKEVETPKEAGEFDNALEKLAETTKTLEKVAPKKEVIVKDESLAKAVNTMAGTLAKMAETIVGLEERLAKVESTPAAVKSKSAVVYKSDADKEEKLAKAASQADPTSELGMKKARYAELEKKFSELGPNEFAKGGFSAEAMTLETKIAELENAQK